MRKVSMSLNFNLGDEITTTPNDRKYYTNELLEQIDEKIKQSKLFVFTEENLSTSCFGKVISYDISESREVFFNIKVFDEFDENLVEHYNVTTSSIGMLDQYNIVRDLNFQNLFLVLKEEPPVLEGIE